MLAESSDRFALLNQLANEFVALYHKGERPSLMGFDSGNR
jgi:hypothetical protein